MIISTLTDPVGIEQINDQDEETTPKNDADQEASFETAIAATGFGKFNCMLLAFVFPASFTQIFEQISVSYVVPIAQCDLDLTLEDKGLLNAVAYAGMISSGFLFGYICDSWGRKKIIVYGYLLHAVLMFMSALSWTFPILLTTKFFTGFMFTGPFSAVASCLSEFHSTKYRSKVQLVRGIAGSAAAICLPLLAWAILPYDIKLSFFDLYSLYSWNMFLMCCCLAPLTSAILFSLIPETPKFLMSQGKNDEALEVFRKVYRMNTGRDDYPIKHLKDETDVDQIRRKSIGSVKSVHTTLVESLSKLKPLFQRPYNLKLVHVCANAFSLLMGSFSLKLWYPQLLTAINDYTVFHNGTSSDMCTMMEDMRNVDVASEECTINFDNSSVYINSIILGGIQFVIFSCAAIIINMFGKKRLAIILTCIAGCCAISIYFATNSVTVVILASTILPFSELTGNILITTTLEIFPTHFRTMALSFHLILARIGLMVGNVTFPFLIRAGCLPPFLFVGILILNSTVLTYLYPDTENKALK